jgi:hypothetical protein
MIPLHGLNGGFPFPELVFLIKDLVHQGLVVELREKEITNLPFLDKLLYPTSVEQVTVAVVVQDPIFRCRKF